MSHVYADNEVLQLRSYGSKILYVPANDIYDAFANQFGLTKGDFILMYSQRVVGIINILQEPIHLYTDWNGKTNYIRWDSRDANQSGDNGTYRVDADTFTGMFYSAGMTWRSSGDGIYRYFSLVYDFDGFIYPKGYKQIFIDDVPVVEYKWTSLSSVHGVDRTLQLTKIKDDKINQGKYAEDNQNDVIENRTEYSNLSHIFNNNGKRILTMNKKSGKEIGLISKPFNIGDSIKSIECIYKKGSTNESFVFDIPGDIQNAYLMIFEDADNQIACFSVISLNDANMTCAYNFSDTSDLMKNENNMRLLYSILHEPVEATSQIYIGSNNEAKNARKIYIGLNNIAKQIKKIYVGVNGLAKEIYHKL